MGVTDAEQAANDLDTRMAEADKDAQSGNVYRSFITDVYKHLPALQDRVNSLAGRYIRLLAVNGEQKIQDQLWDLPPAISVYTKICSLMGPIVPLENTLAMERMDDGRLRELLLDMAVSHAILGELKKAMGAKLTQQVDVFHRKRLAALQKNLDVERAGKAGRGQGLDGAEDEDSSDKESAASTGLLGHHYAQRKGP